MAAQQTGSIVVVDADQGYQGILLQQQLNGLEDDHDLTTIEPAPVPRFDDNTSIWEAMQVMRNYLGEAIAVVDSASGRYLGAIPEAAVINAYLDATDSLRREEHEI